MRDGGGFGWKLAVWAGLPRRGEGDREDLSL